MSASLLRGAAGSQLFVAHAAPSHHQHPLPVVGARAIAGSRCRPVFVRSSSSDEQPSASVSTLVDEPVSTSNGNGASSTNGSAAPTPVLPYAANEELAKAIKELQEAQLASMDSLAPASAWSDDELAWSEPSGSDKWWTSFKLAFALPWRRFQKDSVLAFKLEGDISEPLGGFFAAGTPSIAGVCEALVKAAKDPRVQGVAIEIGPLNIGWGKVQELRRHLQYFKASGKYCVAYMKLGGEKEYYLATGCGEIYCPPTASISLRGFVTGGTFLRGVLDKVGVEPQVERIGGYKSAGDQLLRRTMSPEQREQLTAIMEDIRAEFIREVAAARGKNEEEVVALLDEGVYDMTRLAAGGWVTELWYEDQLVDELKRRTTGKSFEPVEGESENAAKKREAEKDKPLRKVGLKKYSRVGGGAFGLRGKKRIAVLRTTGAILGKASSSSSNSITPDALIPKLRALARNKSIAAVVLRIDSPGGDALASDLMWREIRKLGEKKPVIASMADVAASGGYYLSMGAQAIVAERLTITGSIGVVTGKFNLAELYAKVGYNKELISRGKFAEVLADNRPFSPEEEALFKSAAMHAYESFRNKAAESRGMEQESMQQVAQGRVWSGRAALKNKLVDVLGGVPRAVALARVAAGIKPDERVSVVEASRAQTSPLAALAGGGASSALLMALGALVLRGGLTGNASPLSAALSASASSSLPLGLAAAAVASSPAGAGIAGSDGFSYTMTDVDVATVGCSTAASSSGPLAALTGATGSVSDPWGERFLCEDGGFGTGSLGSSGFGAIGAAVSELVVDALDSLVPEDL